LEIRAKKQSGSMIPNVFIGNKVNLTKPTNNRLITVATPQKKATRINKFSTLQQQGQWTSKFLEKAMENRNFL